MRKYNLIQDKSFKFAIRIVNVAKFLVYEKKEYVLSKQLLRSGTSIGSNVEEAIGAQSKSDFLFKLTIAYKEARETSYWLKLLTATQYIEVELSQSLISDSEEICRIIGKIQITSKKNSESVIRNS